MLVLLTTIILVFNTGCKKSATEAPEKDTPSSSPRVITFAGHEWEVKSSAKEKLGPGPNYFSDSEENVWVDGTGRLHLRITYRNGKWLCAGITLLKSFSYGRYVFEMGSRTDTLDKNIVGGLFTYKNDTQEIDIEFSKWSVTGNIDAQFAVQPSNRTGNKKRFYLDQDSDVTTHWFNWQQDRIDFASYYGAMTDTAATNTIQKWTYTGNDIPPDTDEKVKINLWLFKGVPPSNLKEAEMIVSGLKYNNE
ncbi:glycoside hydrolase family 16 protein [Niabella beijingensis]|uniref:glycoside hydrolase family 16 protein n=1 Tax=Niabella beijingensis TaxID=2872700 RepID=UPI001CBC5561|nr:glycoside hydrolase family 16 protein [Niabella beijingensis]MBZ4192143.1 glycoside hydrolase family 16 protein [Niabella beijingensis]